MVGADWIKSLTQTTMSASEQQESTGQPESKNPAIPEKGTPEYQAYYYQQIEDAVHRAAAMYIETFAHSVRTFRVHDQAVNVLFSRSIQIPRVEYC